MNEDNTNNAQDQADDWSDIEANFLADKGIEREEDKSGEQANGSEDKQTTQGSEEAQGDSENKKSDEEQGSGDDSEKGSGGEEEGSDANQDDQLEQGADEAPQNTTAQYRQTQREIEADNKAMQADVRKELYPEWTDDILDDQGEPIKTPRDVMQYTNPVTKKRFTEEEATAWLFAAQKHKNEERAKMEARVEQVSDVMIQQRDEADQVKGKYGTLLAKLPNLRKEIWADYRATLVVDKDTGLIVDAPVSLYKFFARALRPYEQYVQTLQSQAAEKKTVQDETARKQTQQDREDITSSGNGSVADPEEEAWANAAKKHYEG